MSFCYDFTVFTATYNRAHLLHRVHRSLLTQTYRNFEWLVIDDGSTDGTRSLVQQWRTESDFPIRYLFQRNQGKHVAYNLAVGLARGRFFLTLDSDDSCVPEALAKLRHYWDTIPTDQKWAFSAVTALCKDEQGAVVGDMFPKHITDSDYLDCSYRLKVRGDKWGFQRTDVMRKYPFPVPRHRMSHIPEGIVWSQISRSYKTRCVNELLYVYYTGHDSLTNARSLLDSARAFRMWNTFVLENNLDFLMSDPVEFARHAANLCRFSMHLGEAVLHYIWSLDNVLARVLCLVAFPIGWVKFLVDRRGTRR